MPRSSNILLVEGKDERRLIPELVEQVSNVKWELGQKSYLVDIEDCDGVDAVLEQIVLRWKETDRRIIGVIIDSDEEIASRWHALCRSAPDDVRTKLPKAPVQDGLIVELPNGRAFGAWIMPNNHDAGMTETFLRHLRPTTNQQLLDYVKDAVTESKRRDAPWGKTHRDKAEIHTWLAWQDPPGRQLHDAVKQKILRADSELGVKFVEWLRRLYKL